MQLKYISLGFDGEEEERIGTEVMFMEHETKTRQRLENSIIDLDIPHDPETFPERLILLGKYPVKSVHEIITRQTRPRQGPYNFIPLLSSYYADKVPVSEKYL